MMPAEWKVIHKPIHLGNCFSNNVLGKGRWTQISNQVWFHISKCMLEQAIIDCSVVAVCSALDQKSNTVFLIVIRGGKGRKQYPQVVVSEFKCKTKRVTKSWQNLGTHLSRKSMSNLRGKLLSDNDCRKAEKQCCLWFTNTHFGPENHPFQYNIQSTQQNIVHPNAPS